MPLFQLISDLHLDDHSDNKIDSLVNFLTSHSSGEEYLLIAGDIIDFNHFDLLKSFLNSIHTLYKHIYLILGNHEYYFVDINTADDFFQKQSFPNSTILINRSVLFPDGVILHGTTLWSKTLFPNGGHSVQEINRQFELNYQWLDTVLHKYRYHKQIVMTHHAPLFYYQGNDKVTAYASDLSELIKLRKPLCWVFGHTHINCDFLFENTRLLSNTLGYRDEITGFKDVNFVV